jgi:hypothetical protein
MAAARRALGSSRSKVVNVVKTESFGCSALEENSVTRTMSDVPASKNVENTVRGQQDPGARRVAVVRCDGFQCLAYLDGEVWRDFHTSKELPEVKEIVFTFPN